MLSAYANGIVSFALVFAFALKEGKGLEALYAQWRQVFAIAVLTGFERNLTNASMYFIGGSLKTSLHGFNIIFTFFASAFLGLDMRARRCVLACSCVRAGLFLTASLFLIVGGGIITALGGGAGVAGGGGTRSPWMCSASGVALQLCSSLAYALKFVAMKKALREDRGVLPLGVDSPRTLAPRVSKAQISLIACPATGLLALMFVPVFESTWEAPSCDSVFWLGLCAVGILICELRLTELTSPLTVSVLSAVHNVAIVLLFILKDGEVLSKAQMAGFVISTNGVIFYAWFKHSQSQCDAGVNDITASKIPRMIL